MNGRVNRKHDACEKVTNTPFTTHTCGSVVMRERSGVICFLVLDRSAVHLRAMMVTAEALIRQKREICG